MILGIVAAQAPGAPPAPTYATFDPANKHADIVLSGGNLTATKAGTDALRSVRSTLGVSSGKHYWEITTIQGGFNAPYMLLGVGTSGVNLAASVGSNASGWSYYQETGQKYNNNIGAAFGASWSNNDVVGIALDMNTGSVWFSKNGVWQGGGDPAAGANPAYTGLSGLIYAYASLYRASGGYAHRVIANFGATAFAHTVPAGFRAGLYS